MIILERGSEMPLAIEARVADKWVSLTIPPPANECIGPDTGL